MSSYINPVSLEIVDRIQENCIQNLSWDILTFLDNLLLQRRPIDEIISSVRQEYLDGQKDEEKRATGEMLLAALHSFLMIGISRVVELKRSREKENETEAT
jgi:hypothetical protein